MVSRSLSTRAAKRQLGQLVTRSPRLRNRFLRRVAARSGLFDSGWVQEQVDRPATPQSYFAEQLFADGVAPNPLLEPACVPAGSTSDEPMSAYLTGQLRHVHPLFDQSLYLHQNPAAANDPGRAVGHFLRYATPETRLPTRWLDETDRITWAQYLLAVQPPTNANCDVTANAPLLLFVPAHGPSAAMGLTAQQIAALPELVGGRQWCAVVATTDASEARVVRSLAAITPQLQSLDTGGTITSSANTLIALRRGVAVDQSWIEALLAELSARSANVLSPVVVGWDGLILDQGVSFAGEAIQAGLPQIDSLPAGVPIDRAGRGVVAIDLSCAPVSLAPLVSAARSVDEISALEPVSGMVSQTSSVAVRAQELGGDECAWQPTDKFCHDTATPLPSGCLRFSIRVAAPTGEIGDRWGDVFFAHDLAEAINATQHQAIVERVDQSGRPGRERDNVNLVIRGLERLDPEPGKLNILWVISHPTDVTDEEIRSFDLVFAASESWARSASTMTGRTVLPLLQATNPRRFHYDPSVVRGTSDVFVGSSRKQLRQIVSDAVAAQANLTIHGTGWDGLVDRTFVASDFVSPEAVGRLYQQARSVLSDEWEDMAASGFIVNRIFDALATGAAVISPPVSGLDQVCGSRVLTYDSVADLRACFAAADSMSAAQRASNAEWIRAHHTFEHRVQQLLSAIRSPAE